MSLVFSKFKKSTQRKRKSPIWRIRHAILLVMVLIGGVSTWHFNLYEKSRQHIKIFFRNFSKKYEVSLETVAVKGRKNTDLNDIRKVTDPLIEKPLLEIDIDKISKELEQLSWVQKVQTRRKWPHTLIIDIMERVPIAIWQKHGRMFIVDEEGNKLTELHDLPYPNLPFISGHGAPQSVKGLMQILEENPTVKEQVTSATRVGKRRWNLKLKEGVVVLLPDVHEAEAMKKLAKTLSNLSKINTEISRIDLRQKDRVILKPKTK